MKADYDVLSSKYSSLKADYVSLETDYNNLLLAVERGEALAKSAPWIYEDKRLNVTSKVIPEFLFREIWHYTIRVTVTNVGDKPLDI